MTDPLVYLINLLFKTGTFPDTLKKAVIVPVYKAGDKLNKENYRPIAVTSIIGRLFEKCIKVGLECFLDVNGVLSGSQYGFRAGLSAENAMVHVTEYVMQNFSDKLRTVGIFIDLARAFDTVDHSILLRKLENIGIRGIAYNLFESYLKNRVQKVKINGNLSKETKVKLGVPQGTVLGPILFSLYINDLFSLLPIDDSVCVCYADDTAILVRGKTRQEVLHRAEIYISRVKAWMDQNMLTMNVQKTSYIAFTLNNRVADLSPDLRVHEFLCLVGATNCACVQSIAAKDSVKYLGLFIDKNLKYEAHILYIVNKIRKTIYKFYQLREFLSVKLLNMTYSALVESILSYGLVVWGGMMSSTLNPLNIVQKYIIKIIMGKNRRYSTEMLFVESGLLTVRQLFVRSVLKFMHKYNRYKKLIVHGFSTRSVRNESLSIPQPIYAARQRHISYLGPQLYNIVPLQLRNVVSIHTFSYRVTKWVVSNFQRITGQIPYLS